jgi:hypothetical protein
MARTRSVRTPYTPVFARDVAPIFSQHCVECHRDGGIAPFSLTSYTSAKAHTTQIKPLVVEHVMPPWLPAPGCREFEGANRLSNDEISTIVRWIDGGAPEGEGALPSPPAGENAGWRLGEPDLVFTMSNTFTPPADKDVFRCFLLPYDLPSDLYVRAFDFRSSAHDCVHHGNLYVDPTFETRQFDSRDPASGWNYFDYGLGASPQLISGWGPGSRPLDLPAGVAYRIAAHTQMVLLVHYAAEGKSNCSDSTQVGVYLAKGTVDRLARQVSVYVSSSAIHIPAGARNEVTDRIVLDEDVDLLALSGHMHYIGRSITVDATRPGGGAECLLDIEQWDFHWSSLYKYMNPVALPAGTVLRVVGHYDNTDDNPHNPSYPPREVNGGATSLDEMCGADFVYTRRNERLNIQP